LTRIFKNKPFARFAQKAGLTNAALRASILAADRGLVDADLGGGVIKQRIARPGGGKSGGFRTIILFRLGSLAFFVHGFAKNERASIRQDELDAFKLLAGRMLTYDADALTQAVAAGLFIEVKDDDETIS
jgi:hypothetical protein